MTEPMTQEREQEIRSLVMSGIYRTFFEKCITEELLVEIDRLRAQPDVREVEALRKLYKAEMDLDQYDHFDVPCLRCNALIEKREALSALDALRAKRSGL